MYALFTSLAVYAALFGSSTEATSLPPRVNRRTAIPTEPKGEACPKPNVYTADLVWTNTGASPGLSVTVGETNLTVLLDLGSSVFWVPSADWECVDDIDTKLKHVPQENCAPVQGGTTSPNFTFSGGPIPGARFNSTYNGGKTGVIGDIGYEDIIIDGGLAVTNVTMGVATGWDNPLSGTAYGIMGLAFPSANSYWPESELKAVGGQVKDLTNITHYNPVAIQAAAEGLIAPMFGYYFDGLGEPDGTHCGQMTLGGEPDIPHGEFTADIPVVPGVALSDPSHPVFDLWNIHVDGFKIIPPTPGAQPIVISYLDEPNPDAPAAVAGSAYWNHTHTVDTGAYFSALPDEVYFELIKHFDPPLSKEGSTACDAKIPQLAVTVGGKDVWFNESGILYPEIFNPTEGACDLAIALTNGFGAMLGSPFLINVVAVHEFAEGRTPTVRFAQRVWE